LFRYQLNDKRTWLGLGRYDKRSNSLANARMAATEAKSSINRGEDPIQLKAETKAKAKAEIEAIKKLQQKDEFTFEVCAKEWLKRRASEWMNVKHRAQVRNTLAEYALAHALKDATEKAYARGEQLEKRFVMMQEWGKYAVSGINET
jgi:hypothetical protein